ncbi:hypothetical protein RQP46_000943 [Phenoliferia psychrophenolica]
MPPFSSKAAGSGGYDVPSLSDDEDAGSTATSSRSTWASDSDSTTVLGYVDGPVASSSTLDWKTSRVGGLPTFPPLSTPPSATSAACNVCQQPMPLLTQIYCPLDDSLFERVVYTFACPTKTCRGKAGSVRAWRAGVRWVEEASEPVEEAPVQAKGKEKLRLGDLVFARKSNLDLLTSSFATSSVSSPSTLPSPPKSDDPAWLSHPSYPPQYLTTAYEPAPPPSSIPRLPTQTLAAPPPEDIEDKHREGKGSGGRVKKGAVAKPGKSADAGWGGEGYEVQKVRGVDDVFLRFQERVSREGLQCVRYAHSTTPLPFSSLSPSYNLLFPSTPSAPLGTFDPTRIPRCRHCGSESTFEYQLMPALVASLAKIGLSGTTTSSVVQGKKTVIEQDGVEFATVMVFACLAECGEEEGDGDEAWREEQVCIELEID